MQRSKKKKKKHKWGKKNQRAGTNPEIIKQFWFYMLHRDMEDIKKKRKRPKLNY